MSKRISAVQGSILASMRSGYKLRYMFGYDSYCYLTTPGHPKVTTSALSLECKGMIRRVKVKANGCEFEIVEQPA
jgi:hypothetical protein